MAAPTEWAPENLVGQPHPGLPFAPLLPRQDYPLSLDSQGGLEVLLTRALLGTPLGLLGLSLPLILVSREVLGPLCRPAYL